MLLIDDSAALLRVLNLSLSTMGFRVLTAMSSEGGLQLAAQRQPDIVCVDVGAPGTLGLDAVTALKTLCSAPVIATTGVTDEDLLTQCLSRGADEVLIKPYLSDEDLVPAIHALLGREEQNDLSGDRLSLGEIEIDPIRERLTRRGVEVRLSRTEWRLLRVLISAEGSPVLHKELLSKVWGPFFQQHVGFLGAWISRLAAKLSGDDGLTNHIVNFSDVGYTLVPSKAPGD